MAAVTLEDYVKRLKLFRLKPGESKLSESKATLVSRSLGEPFELADQIIIRSSA